MWKFSVSVLVGLLLGSAAGASDTAVPAVHARSKVNLASLIVNADYPASARAAREQGLVEFTLDVGPNGRVTGCTVTRSSGSPALDSTTCRLMQSRARFTPALDGSGATVADRMTGRLIWRL
jgi:protein TonB